MCIDPKYETTSVALNEALFKTEKFETKAYMHFIVKPDGTSKYLWVLPACAGEP